MIECDHCGKELDEKYIFLPCPYCGEIVWSDEDEEYDKDEDLEDGMLWIDYV